MWLFYCPETYSLNSILKHCSYIFSKGKLTHFVWCSTEEIVIRSRAGGKPLCQSYISRDKFSLQTFFFRDLQGWFLQNWFLSVALALETNPIEDGQLCPYKDLSIEPVVHSRYSTLNPVKSHVSGRTHLTVDVILLFFLGAMTWTLKILHPSCLFRGGHWVPVRWAWFRSPQDWAPLP